MMLLARIRASRLTAVLAWAAVLFLAAWTIVRVGGLERGYPAVALIALTPYLVPLGLVAAVTLLLLRRPGLAGAALACAVVIAIAVLPRVLAGPPPDPRPEGPELRVIGANLHYGDADLEQLAGIAAEYDADAVVLSELTSEAAAAVARSPLAELMPHSALDPRRSAWGTGILSRHPLRRLPAPGTRGYDEPTLIAAVELPDGVPAEIHAIHPLPPTNSSAVADNTRYLEAIPPAPASGPPPILVGDFNATLDDSRLRDVIGTGYADAADATGAGLTPTWPDDLYPPPVTIDHVIADERVEVLDFDTFEIDGTDHRAVAAVLRLPSRAQQLEAG